MASRLNVLFRNAPRQFLERTVVFTEALYEPECQAPLRTRGINFYDLEPMGPHARLTVLAGLHLYQDATISGYFLPAGGAVYLPATDGPHQFAFLTSFLNARLWVAREGPELIRLFHDESGVGDLPRSMLAPTEAMSDGISFSTCVQTHLPGTLQATALLYKPPGEVWRLLVQQIVGVPERELVFRVVERPLRY